MVPRAQFAIFCRSRLLDKQKRERDAQIPTNQVAITRYLDDQRWMSYRKQVVKEVICRKRRLNDWSDVQDWDNSGSRDTTQIPS